MMRTRRLVLLFVLALGSGVAGACSSFSGNGDVVSDAGAGADATAATEAGAGAADASVTDASAKDAGAIDASQVPFCKQLDGAAYCADFDDPLLAYGPFTPFQGGDASLSIADADSVSPPSSLFATSDPNPGTPQNQAVIVLDLPNAQARHAEVDLRVTTTGTQGTVVELYPLQGANPLSGAYVGYAGQVGVASFRADGGFVASGTLLGTKPTTWFHVSIDVVAVDGGFSATVQTSVGGTSTPAVTVSMPGVGDKTRFMFGADPAGPLDAGPFSVRVDNVFVQ